MEAMSSSSKSDLEINSLYLSEQFAKDFKATVDGKTEQSRPFPHFALPEFLSKTELLSGIRDDLQKISWRRKENDLYSFWLSKDFANFKSEDFPSLTVFRDFLKGDIYRWLSKVSGVKLSPKMAITASKYGYGDVLLPHDDQLENRAFAFVYYISENWNPEDGGQLRLFGSNGQNVPQKVEKSLTPEENLFILFPVSVRSWHTIAEIVSAEKFRLSINGWFHSDSISYSKIPQELSVKKMKPHLEITYDEVIQWINPEYIAPHQQKSVRRVFEQNSEINLINFLQAEKYNEVLGELDRLEFEVIGPPNKMCIEKVIESSLPVDSSLRTLLRLCRSKPMALLLSQWTGLNLLSVSEEAGDEEPVSKKAKLEGEAERQESSQNAEDFDIQYTSAFNRFSKGSYTMIDDYTASENRSDGFCLDLKLFFCSTTWADGYGGFCSYTAVNEKKEILRILPTGNSAAVVYREPDVLSFVKYVNSRAKDRSYCVMNCTYFGVNVDDDTDDEDEEQGAGPSGYAGEDTDSGSEDEDGSSSENA